MLQRLTVGAVFFILIVGVLCWYSSANKVSAQAASATVVSKKPSPSATIDHERQGNQMPIQPFAPDLLEGDTRQIVFVRAIGGQQVGTLSAWEKIGDRWTLAFPTIEVVLGARGVVSAEEKKEGDKSTPSGIYRLSRAFGYQPFLTTKLNYIKLTDNHYWVDDPSSASYNQLVDKKPNAGSYEIMKRKDDLYKLGIIVEYNTDPVVSGKGSAIFIHVWRGPGQPTAGCIAMAEIDVIKLLKWIDPHQCPVIVLQRPFVKQKV